MPPSLSFVTQSMRIVVTEDVLPVATAEAVAAVATVIDLPKTLLSHRVQTIILVSLV
jgi:hypothetical protein